MRSKLIYFSSPPVPFPRERRRFIAALFAHGSSVAITLLCLSSSTLNAQTPPADPIASAKFIGASTCSSTSCHGGANTNLHQYAVWSKLDFHTRAYATLTRPRSSRIADALKISNPTQDRACTACHDPMHTVPADRRAATAHIALGISCENCHGPAEPWLRSHTRTNDWTHADRVASGMRALQSLYSRANICVACHQNVDPGILRAGHPELIFELDGQAVTQPKHWQEHPDWHGAQAWLIGQAVALREMSWQLDEETRPDASMTNRWAGLTWLLQRAPAIDDRLPAFPSPDPRPTASGFNQTREWSDTLARRVAELPWSADLTRKWLTQLAGTSDEFNNQAVGQPLQARRAERLALALDRLVLSLPTTQTNPPGDAELNGLFKSVQSVPDFKPAEFARQLKEFSQAAAVVKTAAQSK